MIHAVACDLIPAPAGCAYDAASLAFDGALDPTPSVARTGAWKGALVLGGPSSRRPGIARLRLNASNGAPPAGRLDRLKVRKHQRCIPGHKSPHAGAERQPLDREVLQSPKGSAKEAARASWGWAASPAVAD